MAEQVTCVCGRKFHVSSGQNCQCRKCGRWWSGQKLGPVECVVAVLCGGEVAGAQNKKGDRQRNQKHNSRGKQTDRKRPPNNPVGAALRWIFG